MLLRKHRPFVWDQEKAILKEDRFRSCFAFQNVSAIRLERDALQIQCLGKSNIGMSRLGEIIQVLQTNDDAIFQDWTAAFARTFAISKKPMLLVISFFL